MAKHFKLLCGFCCLILITLFCIPANAAQPTIVTSLTNLQTTRVYLSPDRESLPIGLLEDGQAVHVVARLGNFYRIDCYGQICYISIEQVEQVGSREYYVNCSNRSEDTVYMPTLNPLNLEALRQDILNTAQAQIGDVYEFGGESPGGFDCSGLMEYIFYVNDFYIPRTADPQLAAGLIIAPENLNPGDLLFFNETDDSGDFVTHVAIYIGDRNLIHAGFKGGVCIRSLDIDYFAERFVCARRVLIAGAFPVSSHYYLAVN